MYGSRDVCVEECMYGGVDVWRMCVGECLSGIVCLYVRGMGSERAGNTSVYGCLKWCACGGIC